RLPPALVSALPPPAAPPLFPYTTLFRSQLGKLGREARRGLVQEQQLRVQHQRPGHGHHLLLPAAHGAGLLAPALLEDGEQFEHLDRKSTRLNSSHVKSSYAVFCLKKKKS